MEAELLIKGCWPMSSMRNDSDGALDLSINAVLGLFFDIYVMIYHKTGSFRILKPHVPRLPPPSPLHTYTIQLCIRFKMSAGMGKKWVTTSTEAYIPLSISGLGF